MGHLMRLELTQFSLPTNDTTWDAPSRLEWAVCFGTGSVLWWLLIGRDCLTRLPEMHGGCVSQARLTYSKSLRSTPLAITHLGGARFLAWRMKRSFSGECRLGLKYFMLARRVWATVLRLDPLKTRPCATLARLAGNGTISNINYDTSSGDL